MNIDFDDLNDTEEVESVPLDLNVIKEKIPTFPSTKLCEMIVCDRYFGCYKELAIMCMEELSTRRLNGDDFNFELNIDESFNQLPKLEFNIPNLADTLRQIVKRK